MTRQCHKQAQHVGKASIGPTAGQGTDTTGARIASSAFADEYQERHAKKVRREHDHDGDDDMGEFVKYGMGDMKESATTRALPRKATTRRSTR